MRALHRLMRRFAAGEDGAAAVEYAVMLALIIGVCIATIGTLGLNTKQVCDAVCKAFGKT